MHTIIRTTIELFTSISACRLKPRRLILVCESIVRFAQYTRLKEIVRPCSRRMYPGDVIVLAAVAVRLQTRRELFAYRVIISGDMHIHVLKI